MDNTKEIIYDNVIRSKLWTDNFECINNVISFNNIENLFKYKIEYPNGIILLKAMVRLDRDITFTLCWNDDLFYCNIPPLGDRYIFFKNWKEYFNHKHTIEYLRSKGYTKTYEESYIYRL